MSQQSFGPAVVHNEDGTFTAIFSYCMFRIRETCTWQHLPNGDKVLPQGTEETPDWCEMKAQMLEDVKQ